MIFLTAWLLLPILLLALLIDRWLGEPPAAIHPVVGMGKYLDFFGRWAAPLANHAHPSRWRSALLGALFWLLGAALVLGAAYAVQGWLITLLLHQLQSTAHPYLWAWGMALCLALLLKPLFAWRMLAAEVQAVDAALQNSLQAGRERVAYLVSRDTSALTESQVREAAIATLAENFNDSLVAPLFWFCLGGLPAAALYRYANTADACWGYIGLRQGRDWTYAGRFAARADDVLSWLPARLTALIIFIAAQAGLTAQTSKNTLKNIRFNARLTPSPNSGWPMAAAALALDLRLGKTGVYLLHPEGSACEADSIDRAWRLLRRAWRLILLACILCCALAWAALLLESYFASLGVSS